MSCINFLPNLAILTLSETKGKNQLRLSRFVSDPLFGSNSPQETYLNMMKFFESIHIYLFMSHPQTGRWDRRKAKRSGAILDKSESPDILFMVLNMTYLSNVKPWPHFPQSLPRSGLVLQTVIDNLVRYICCLFPIDLFDWQVQYSLVIKLLIWCSRGKLSGLELYRSFTEELAQVSLEDKYFVLRNRFKKIA